MSWDFPTKANSNYFGHIRSPLEGPEMTYRYWNETTLDHRTVNFASATKGVPGTVLKNETSESRGLWHTLVPNWMRRGGTDSVQAYRVRLDRRNVMIRPPCQVVDAEDLPRGLIEQHGLYLCYDGLSLSPGDKVEVDLVEGPDGVGQSHGVIVRKISDAVPPTATESCGDVASRFESQAAQGNVAPTDTTEDSDAPAGPPLEGLSAPDDQGVFEFGPFDSGVFQGAQAGTRGVYITSEPGTRDAPTTSQGQGTSNHAGMDFSTKDRGSLPLYAVSAGQVVSSGPQMSRRGAACDEPCGYGQRIRLRITKNDKTYYVVYAHLATNGRLVSQGEEVRAGQHIGWSGNTGNTSGPHLHFEVRLGSTTGAVVNPRDVLPPGYLPS